MSKPYSLTLSINDGVGSNCSINATAVLNEGVKVRLLQKPFKQWTIKTKFPKEQLNSIKPSIEKEADRWAESVIEKENPNELASNQKAG